MMEAIRSFAGKIPILGVCLGHQGIGEVFGGNVVSAPSLVHGKTADVKHDGKTIFHGVPSPFAAARYHSLVVDAGSVPEALEVSATTHEGVIMGLRHRELPVEGVQFHPESILTTVGRQLLGNFLALVQRRK
jgi:anthranilate synthase/aminodeoxychorismate synthase-like glutamine amidotransferase